MYKIDSVTGNRDYICGRSNDKRVTDLKQGTARFYESFKFYPHLLLQKNLLVCSQRGPRRPQKLSSIVKKICKLRDHSSMFYWWDSDDNRIRS